MFTLRQYLAALADTRGLLRTLGEVELCRDASGAPLYSAGNSAAVFRVRHRGRERALRCYFRRRRNLGAIYGEAYLPEELFLHTSPTEGCYVDIVLCDWIPGRNLGEHIDEAVATEDRAALAALARRFDRLALAMVSDDRAHGDLKPENIVVDPAGDLRPIDLDGLYLPAFAGERSPELGTAAYQHPARTAEDFDERLDDYPAALLSTALHALALDPSFGRRYASADGLLFTPARIAADPALEEALALFERRGEAVAYRIGRLLRSPSLRLPALAPLLEEAVRRAERKEGIEARRKTEEAIGSTLEATRRRAEVTPGTATRAAAGMAAWAATEPELFVRDGLWGFRTGERVTIPPLYDEGFDFTEGLAAVRLGRVWHYIDTAGRTALSCPGCEAVKPFRGGTTEVERQGRRLRIDRRGREV